MRMIWAVGFSGETRVTTQPVPLAALPPQVQEPEGGDEQVGKVDAVYDEAICRGDDVIYPLTDEPEPIGPEV